MVECSSEQLFKPLSSEPLTLIPLAKRHRDPLRVCVEADTNIWTLYPTDWRGPAFCRRFDEALAAVDRNLYAVLLDGEVVGMTGWLNLARARQTVEIENSYLHPAVRGTGVNGQAKRLMLDHAFACGMRRVEFRVDARNARSLAALSKLRAIEEGRLRAERITWTGHAHTTVLLSILHDEWSA